MSEPAGKRDSDVVHRHNLTGRGERAPARFGLRMRLPAGDAFGGILGTDWEKTRWFRSEPERDAAIAALVRQHPYYRLGDRPTLSLEKVNRSEAIRSEAHGRRPETGAGPGD